MRYPEFKYVDSALNGVHRRNKVMQLGELMLQDHQFDCYTTYFRFTENYAKHWERNGKSVKGYKGVCFSDFIPIDIDRKDAAESLKVARNFLQWMDCALEVPLESITVFYSGWKGFHIYLPVSLLGEIEPSANLPKRFRKFVSSLGDWGFDLAIYDVNRLLRTENTIHSETGLYKVRLKISEILYLTCSEIRRVATAPRESNDFPDYYEWDSVPSFVELWERTKPTHQESRAFSGGPSTLDFPSVKEGRRNKTSFKIAQTLKSKGFTLNEAKEYIVKDWNPKNHPPETDTASLCRTVESAFKYNISDSGTTGITKHLRNDPYFNSFDCEQKTVYIHLLIHLNEVEKTVWGKYDCKPHQLIFSYQSIAANTGVNIQRVRTLIKNLERWGRISIETLFSQRGHPECSRMTFHCFTTDPNQHEN